MSGFRKVIGCRPGQRARQGAGRRPITSHAGTRGQQALLYGVLEYPVQCQRLQHIGNLPPKRDTGVRGPASNALILRCQGRRLRDRGVIGVALGLSEDL